MIKIKAVKYKNLITFFLFNINSIIQPKLELMRYKHLVVLEENFVVPHEMLKILEIWPMSCHILTP